MVALTKSYFEERKEKFYCKSLLVYKGTCQKGRELIISEKGELEKISRFVPTAPGTGQDPVRLFFVGQTLYVVDNEVGPSGEGGDMGSTDCPFWRSNRTELRVRGTLHRQSQDNVSTVVSGGVCKRGVRL